MGVEDVKKIVAEMNAKEIDVESQLIEIATPTIKATDEMIEITEKNLGVILPESYKIFLKEILKWKYIFVRSRTACKRWARCWQMSVYNKKF